MISCRRATIAVFCLLGLICCEQRSSSSATSSKTQTAKQSKQSPSTTKDATQSEVIALSAAQKLGGALKKKLLDAMQQGGPNEAVKVCADQAQQITTEISRQTGVRLGRSALRIRNPKNAGPLWVRHWLMQNRNHPEPKPWQQKTENGARVILPIRTEAMCLTCHGDPQAIPPDVSKTLAKKYPRDEATGYQLGDLRGALWAEYLEKKNPEHP